jgi:hypothetical protein
MHIAVRAGANSDSLVTALVGNKADYRDGSADSRAEVVKEDGQRCAKELNTKYFEVSAVCLRHYNYNFTRQFSSCLLGLQIANTDVTEPFAYIAREFYHR